MCLTPSPALFPYTGLGKAKAAGHHRARPMDRGPFQGRACLDETRSRTAVSTWGAWGGEEEDC